MTEKVEREDVAKKRRNREQTRRRILEATRNALMHKTIDALGVREIAADAGVDPALITRYFASKDNLIREALEPDEPLIGESLTDVAAIATHLAQVFLAETAFNPISALVASASSPAGQDVLRTLFEDGGIDPIAARLGEHDRDHALNAALALSFLAGLSLLRDILRVRPLADLSAEQLQRRVETVVETLLRPGSKRGA